MEAQLDENDVKRLSARNFSNKTTPVAESRLSRRRRALYQVASISTTKFLKKKKKKTTTRNSTPSKNKIINLFERR